MKKSIMDHPEDNLTHAETRSQGAVLKSGEGAKFEKSITIQRPISKVYDFWRNLENLPRFMKHLQSVTVKDEIVSHWITQPTHFEWDAELIEDRVDEIISWQSLPGGDVNTAGTVRFSPTPDNLGTVVKITFKYSPPGGKLAVKIAGLFGHDAETIIEEDLQRFKEILEKGEAATNRAHH